jgi:hypothetical protein
MALRLSWAPLVLAVAVAGCLYAFWLARQCAHAVVTA